MEVTNIKYDIKSNENNNSGANIFIFTFENGLKEKLSIYMGNSVVDIKEKYMSNIEYSAEPITNTDESYMLYAQEIINKNLCQFSYDELTENML